MSVDARKSSSGLFFRAVAVAHGFFPLALHIAIGGRAALTQGRAIAADMRLVADEQDLGAALALAMFLEAEGLNDLRADQIAAVAHQAQRLRHRRDLLVDRRDRG